MAYSKVVLSRNGVSETLIDLTSDTVSADVTRTGYTGHDKAGTSFTGTFEGSSITRSTGTLMEGVVWTMSGNVVTLTAADVDLSTVSGTLPEATWPTVAVRAGAYCISNSSVYVSVSTDGAVSTSADSGDTGSFTVTWIAGVS